MNNIHTIHRLAQAASLQAAPWLTGLLVATCITAPSFAREDVAQTKARLAQERAACLAGKSHQDTKTCLQEVKGADIESRRGGLDGDPATYTRNQLQRCERLPASDKRDCIARMQGRGTTEGSVAAGGIQRVLVTREVVPTTAAVASAPTASSPTSR